MSWRSVFDAADAAQSGRLGVGTYEARITKAEETVTKSGKPSFRFTFSCNGDLAWLNQLVPDGPQAKGASWFVELMQVLGITPAMLDADTHMALQSVVGRTASIDVTERDGWTNVKVKHLIDERELAGGDPW